MWTDFTINYFVDILKDSLTRRCWPFTGNKWERITFQRLLHDYYVYCTTISWFSLMLNSTNQNQSKSINVFLEDSLSSWAVYTSNCFHRNKIVKKFERRSLLRWQILFNASTIETATFKRRIFRLAKINKLFHFSMAFPSCSWPHREEISPRLARTWHKHVNSSSSPISNDS